MSENRLFAIGNSKYIRKDIFADLPLAENDARTIYEVLVDSYNGIFDSWYSHLGLNYSKKQFVDELEKFFSTVNRGDFILFYFSGHGYTLNGKSYHLIMKDSLNKNASYSSSTFNIEQLISYFIEKRIDRYVVILDSCQSGQAIRIPGARQREADTEKFKISSIDSILNSFSGYGKVFITSANFYQSALELDKLKHGLFTYYFIEALTSANLVPSNYKYIDVSSVYKHVYNSIKDKHPDIDQVPLFSGQSMQGELFISKNIGYITDDRNSKFSNSKDSLATLVFTRVDTYQHLDTALTLEIDDKIIGYIGTDRSLKISVTPGLKKVRLYFEYTEIDTVHNDDFSEDIETEYKGTSDKREIMTIANDIHVYKIGIYRERKWRFIWRDDYYFVYIKKI